MILMTMPARAPQPAPPTPPALTPAEIAARQAQQRQMRTIIIVAAIAAVVLLLLLAVAVYALLQPGVPTDRIRDVFIIVVSLETLIVGVALIVLLVQLASLINLLQNEVRPILEATSETVKTLRGTAAFLGESVVEPVIKLNGYLASIQRVLELMGVKRK
jgi:amino acid permease